MTTKALRQKDFTKIFVDGVLSLKKPGKCHDFYLKKWEISR